MRRVVVILTASLCLALKLPAQTQEVKVAAGIFIGIVQEDGKGPYQLILKEAARRAGITVSETVYPLKRAIQQFVDKGVLAIYGMTDSIVAEIGAD